MSILYYKLFFCSDDITYSILITLLPIRGNSVLFFIFLISESNHIPGEGRQSKVNIKNFVDSKMGIIVKHS